MFWLFLILRIAKNYVMQSDWNDVRSDGEDEDDEDVIANKKGEGKRLLEERKEEKVEIQLNGKPMEGHAVNGNEKEPVAVTPRRSERKKDR